MPTYSYYCSDCGLHFELFFNIKDYNSNPVCECGSKKTQRNYTEDLSTISGSVKKSDSELKTVGDLANRNRDRLSEDQKQYLQKKHNDYKDNKETKELPKGMSRIKKPSHKIKWT